MFLVSFGWVIAGIKPQVKYRRQIEIVPRFVRTYFTIEVCDPDLAQIGHNEYKAEQEYV
jgi:hypothetical protein